MGHAFFAPSSAPRVVRCPASLLLTAGMPDTQSEDAAHGTAAHWIGDMCLRGNHNTDRYAGCIIAVDELGNCEFQHELNREQIAEDAAFGHRYIFEVDDEMVYAVQEYIDWCNDLPGEKYPECRVDITDWCPRDSENVFVPAAAYEPQGGTSDHAACSPGLLVITDLKYGKGVKVFAERNEQAVLYALGFIKEWDWLYDFERIVIRICQPRLDHKDVWEVSREEIEEIGRHILERFTLALRDDAPFGPSEKACKFCKASGLCRAQAEYLSEIRALAFDNLDEVTDLPVFTVPDPRLLTIDELVEGWRAHKLYQARFDAIERELLKAMEDGIDVPGLKLIEARTFRAWKSEEEAELALEMLGISGEKITKTTLISPAQAEKLLPKAKRGVIQTLVFKPRGGPTLAEESDNRLSYDEVKNAQLGEVFANLDEDPFA